VVPSAQYRSPTTRSAQADRLDPHRDTWGWRPARPGRFANYTEGQASARTEEAAWTPPPGTLTIDIHSHAGRVTVSRDPKLGANRPFLPVAEPMRTGGMHVVCLAIVTDTLAVHVAASGKRFEAFRTPEPGELYQLGMTEFARAQRLIEKERLHVVTDAASLAAQGTRGPSVIIASEGADFLEGRMRPTRSTVCGIFSLRPTG